MSEKKTLKEFIDDNYRLIATIGVAAALTALFTRVEGGEIVVAVSFVMLIVLGWELSNQFPLMASRKLRLFEVLCHNLLGFTTIYLLLYYTNFLLWLIPAVLFVLFFFPILRVINFLVERPIFKKGAHGLRYGIMLTVVLFLGILMGVLIRLILGW